MVGASELPSCNTTLGAIVPFERASNTVADSMMDGGDRGPGSPGMPRASSGGGIPAPSQAALTPGKAAAGAAAAAAASKAAAQGLHKVRAETCMPETACTSHDHHSDMTVDPDPDPDPDCHLTCCARLSNTATKVT